MLFQTTSKDKFILIGVNCINILKYFSFCDTLLLENMQMIIDQYYLASGSNKELLFNRGESMDSLKWDKEFALEQAAEDTELLQELIDIFKISCTSDFNAIEQGLATADAETVCSAAHSIKGAAASLGIVGIRELALEIESDSRDGSLALAQKRIDDLRNLLQLLQNL